MRFDNMMYDFDVGTESMCDFHSQTKTHTKYVNVGHKGYIGWWYLQENLYSQVNTKNLIVPRQKHGSQQKNKNIGVTISLPTV